jgi:hypothetical protein
MPHQPPPDRRPHRRRIGARGTTLGACAVLLAACVSSSVLLAGGATGRTSRTAAQQQRITAQVAAGASLARAASHAPRARRGGCPKTVDVPGQGPSCRTTDGLYLVPQRTGAPLYTHGPDIVAATARTGGSGGFGSRDSIVCAPASRTRHVVLLYLLPSDFASGQGDVHGDRSLEVVPQLRQAIYDASARIDARAGELAQGARRRLRVLCDDDGQASVERVVLPRTAATYRNDANGFSLIGDDLETMGYLPDYDGYADAHVPAVRRVLGYYDADFNPGYAGQGTLFRRSSLLRQGMPARDPLISRTVRNINNNPPSASIAIQYGTSYAGVPDPPLYTSLLHELSHTMGAVQDEPPTSSDAGHCIDGLDIMCYADTASSTYAETACPDVAAPQTPDDERYDCNGDTYFNPSPPTGSPLRDPTTWQLGLPANETLAISAATAPAGVGAVAVAGRGTRITVRWAAVAGATGYEVAARRPGGPWSYTYVTRPAAAPSLAPSSTYELHVGAVGRDLVLGPRALARATTGRDTSAPSRPTGVRFASSTRTSVRLRFVVAADNVRATRYRVERRVGRRWAILRWFAAPPARIAKVGQVVTSPGITGLRAGTRTTLRLRAVDARGNVSLPSRAFVVSTRR